jgi:AraC-like DNA-binding protein
MEGMITERLAELLEIHAANNGHTVSALDGIFFIRSTEPIPRSPAIYEPSIVIVGQGRKKGYLGGEVYTYDAFNYLVLSVPLPLECETVEASPEKPALAVSIRVTLTTLGELLTEMDDYDGPSMPAQRGIYATPLDSELTGAVIRLLECLRSPMDSRILGPQVVREVIYRVLLGEPGGALRGMANRHSHFSRIAKVLKLIHSEYPNSLDVDTLAAEANMSVSTFFHNFKAVTALSPLQYLKSIRLHKARMLMVQEGLNASSAANVVGYESVSQFSREFKRFFGASPLVEVSRIREKGT